MRFPDLEQAFAMEREDMAVTKIWMYLSKFVEDDPELNTFTQPQRYVLVVEDFEAEINNGGFDQYFVNSAGNHAMTCVKALEEIGADDALDLLKQAIAVFPEGKVPADREERFALLEKIWEKQESEEAPGAWEHLDNRYYEIGIDLGSLMMKYVRAHADEI
jgi:hypothetical protein